MRCNNCQVNIKCKADRCPLCGAPVNSDGEVPFAKKDKASLKRFYLTLSLLIVLLIATAICITLNVLIYKDFAWSSIVAVGCFFIYYTVFYTIFTQNRLHKRILGQAIIFGISIIVIKLFVNGSAFGYSLAILIATQFYQAVLGIYLIIKKETASKYSLTAISTSVVCLIYNVIFLFINKPTELDLSATPSFNTEAYLMRLNLPIMVSICFTVVCIIVLVAVFAKSLKGELKKAFHQ